MAYVPKSGDIVWLHFNVQTEQKPTEQPVLVLSPARYNRLGLMLCCPITSRPTGYPFEVAIAGTHPSAALADQINSLRWTDRKTTCKGAVAPVELAEARAKALALMEG